VVNRVSTVGVVIGAITFAFLLALLLSAGRNPILRRIALRNAVRWPGSTALVVFGTMIGTAMITGSLVVGDNVRDWVYRDIEERLGEIDQVVFLPDPHGVTGGRVQQNPDMLFFPTDLVAPFAIEQINNTLEADKSRASVNGVLPVIQRAVPVRGVSGATGEVTGALGEIMVLAVDWHQLARFGDDPPDVGQPIPGAAVISETSAELLNLAVGDTVQIITGDGTSDFPVETIVPRRGIAGYGGLGWEGLQGTIMISLSDGQTLFAAGESEVNSVLVSHTGKVTESHANSDDIRATLEPLLHNADLRGQFQIFPIKDHLVQEAIFIPIVFLIFSSFVVVAGIALTVNIYVSLAEERRGSMGITRALGMRRGHLIRLYLYEGAIYSLLAAAAGVAVGLGLARVIFLGISRTVDVVEFGEFIFQPGSLLVAAATGVLISMGTVLFTSLRTSHINIVAAMRGLAEPRQVHRSWRTMAWPLLVVLSGIGLTVVALTTSAVFAWVLGPVLLIVGVGFLIRGTGLYIGIRALQARGVLTTSFLAAMVYAWMTNEFSAVVQQEHEASPLAFILIALVLIFGGVGVLALNLPLMLKPLQWMSTRARRALPMMRMALAYPGAKPAGTSFTILMFTVVLFVVTLMHVMLGLFSESIEDISEFDFGGFDVLAFPNPANPLPDFGERIRESDTPELAAVSDVAGLFFANVELPDYRQSDYDKHRSGDADETAGALNEQLIGVDDVFLRKTRTVLSERASEFASDRDVWDAMVENPNLVIVDNEYRADGADRDRPPLSPGDTIMLEHPESGTAVEKQVAGVMQIQFFWQTPMRGILVNAETMQNEFSTGEINAPPLYLVSVEPQIDDRAVSAAIERELFETGIQTTSVSEMVDEERQWLGFMRIIQGFLGFGLFVGVAGLAVVATRAVHQRRRDIGTLRALGFRRGMILGYFLAEAALVALIGILLGTGIGSLSSVILYRYVLPEGTDIAFAYPTTEVTLTGLGIFVIALAFTVTPAIRASNLSVVEALRPME
jgi:putative ABC transport system permease protein